MQANTPLTSFIATYIAICFVVAIPLSIIFASFNLSFSGGVPVGNFSPINNGVAAILCAAIGVVFVRGNKPNNGTLFQIAWISTAVTLGTWMILFLPAMLAGGVLDPFKKFIEAVYTLSIFGLSTYFSMWIKFRRRILSREAPTHFE